ncbi:radical SAM family heme chaperone HemW [Roseovarius indicus]|uniref:Heme chaperone HemW n=1 Tax=Roseovarius indicus TaxID=540747 RepID=A0A0T5PDY8_9RHOB|nr:radical SAM family heme chaperone HemW [Roseovarius indicus]KRS19315.1 coproporphyrinogen III oxidase [Roseovarius indicus]QEW29387.1 Oxygen-independent coproporphyrinogen-III oxidase 1 [Roseovarius indicus]SFD75265.1 oxygen-independent coproporphyrinogen-3 oxidase [Roseovarius indicus]
MTDDWQNGGFGLYIHWPFCEAKCPYCDFNSHVTRNIDQNRWKRAYLSEIDRYAEMLPNRVLNTVYFGGGTPSLMDPSVVSDVLERIRKSWPVANDLEVTLEANPGSVEAGRFSAYADAGVSRVSMGVQALNDADLRKLGRIHSVAEAYQAFDIARKFFNRVSFDLIYARQDQTVEAWRSELKEALSMAVDHLSLYQLTIEPGTAFGERFERGKLRGLPDDDRSGDLYEATQEICGTAGLPAYEVSNHAKPGAESRHNLVYWRYGDYCGIGPGAHGRITLDGQRHATEAFWQPGKWLAGVEASEKVEDRSAIGGQDQADEYLMMGLRLTDGIDARRYKAMSEKDLSANTLTRLEEIGMIVQDRHYIRATAGGRMVLNAVIKELLSD